MEDSPSTPPPSTEATAAFTSIPEAPSAEEQLDKNQIRKAVEALLAHCKSRKNNNGFLLNENENLFLMVILWKIPSKELRVRLPLPHGIRSDLEEICLFTKDEPNKTPEQTERFYRKLLNKHGIKTISRIIPLQTLKKEYKPYEAKLRLMSSFDFFLTDARIRRLLPTHIGRHFYQRKKVPVSVNLLTKNLSTEINESIGGTVLNISKSGSCNTIRIGHTAMQTEHITENIIAVTKGLSEKLPEKWKSVKLMFVKTERSVALPIFSSFVTSWDETTKHYLPKKKRVTKKSPQRRRLEKQKWKKKNRKIQQQPSSVLTKGNIAPKSGAPVKKPGTQKKTPEHGKKKRGGVKAQLKLTNDSEDEIPQLVPIGTAPAKENVETQKHATGNKSLKKRKALPASDAMKAAEPETPCEAPGKKPKMREEAEKERNPLLTKKDPRQTPKKPEAKVFATSTKSARKAPRTPKRSPKVPHST
ncbi:ribosomal L1 domain-containing protein 1 [Nycticebus coucang]|uniref:ribosomal L1 domain-containing protein 1 n=1 Tax=Nycticebus coucang TaxID=9470 RepID=UPI00234D4BAE|nr:ribosomal L1 domain-containing protein 1 [Nycticebus coucang]